MAQEDWCSTGERTRVEVQSGLHQELCRLGAGRGPAIFLYYYLVRGIASCLTANTADHPSADPDPRGRTVCADSGLARLSAHPMDRHGRRPLPPSLARLLLFVWFDRPAFRCSSSRMSLVPGRRLQCPLPCRHRRHQPAPGAADDFPDARLRCSPAGASPRTRKVVHGLHAPSRRPACSACSSPSTWSCSTSSGKSC